MYHVVFKAFDNVTFQISPVAFELFGKPIYWYGILITVGIILSAVYAFWRAKKLGIRLDDMYDYAIFLIIGGIVGARAMYVLTTLHTGDYKSFVDVIAVWNGGLAIYGGIIGGLIAVSCVSLFKKIKLLRVLDAIAPSVMIGQAIGRWGNFFNQEAFGCNTTLPWGMRSEQTIEYLEKNQASIEAQGMNIDPSGFVHPTFLYECLWNILGFILINFFYKRRKFDGQMFFMYITWYGLGRAFIEMLRTDSLYIPGTPVRISMLIGFLCFGGGIAAMIVLGLRSKKDPEAVKAGAYYGKSEYKNDPDYKPERKGAKKSEDTVVEESQEEAETPEEETPAEKATIEEETPAEDPAAEEETPAEGPEPEEHTAENEPEEDFEEVSEENDITEEEPEDEKDGSDN